jgi:hypothetical protein
MQQHVRDLKSDVSLIKSKLLHNRLLLLYNKKILIKLHTFIIEKLSLTEIVIFVVLKTAFIYFF